MTILNFFRTNNNIKIINNSLKLIKNIRKEFEVDVQMYCYQIEMIDLLNDSLIKLSNGEDVYLFCNGLRKLIGMISRSLDGGGTEKSENYMELLASNLKEIEEEYRNHIKIMDRQTGRTYTLTEFKKAFPNL